MKVMKSTLLTPRGRRRGRGRGRGRHCRRRCRHGRRSLSGIAVFACISLNPSDKSTYFTNQVVDLTELNFIRLLRATGRSIL